MSNRLFETRRSPEATSAQLDIIGRRRLWYTLSAAILVPAVIALLIFGLKLGIDFTGGSVLEVEGQLDRQRVEAVAGGQNLENLSITAGGEGRWLVRYRLPENSQTTQASFEDELGQLGLETVRYDQVGPSVSRDLVKNAFAAIAVMSAAIVLYITFVFRKVPRGVSSLSFGVATMAAAFAHDALFVLGVFAILGRFGNVEVDTFIVTAILTVIGFSIHDTVVVFDRIREKLAASSSSQTAPGQFAKTVNDSVNETLVRSLNTSLVIVLVLLALFLFGGATTRYFILALLLGMVSGTYSSIFVAAPLLVTWHNRLTRPAQERRKAKPKKTKKPKPKPNKKSHREKSTK